MKRVRVSYDGFTGAVTEVGKEAGRALVGYLDATAGAVVGQFEVRKQVAAYEGDKGRGHVV